MIIRLLVILCLTFAPGVASADADQVRDRIVRELRDDGYDEIRIYRTFLGRLRFVGEDTRSRREIVVNPTTGVILRDYLRFFDQDDEDDDPDEEEVEDQEDNSGSGSGDDDNDDDEDDEADDESDDEDDDDESDNSGSGSSNSGSGSSNSGSGSSDDDD